MADNTVRPVPDIIVEDEAWGDMEPLVRTCFDIVIARQPEGVRDGTIALLFTTDAHLHQLNRDFRGKDKPTNVLSFPGDQDGDETALMGDAAPAPHIGDIALARETCAREAEEKGVPLKDHAAHLIFHGILHLFGYDHIDAADAVTMEGLETDLLAAMGINDPYAE